MEKMRVLGFNGSTTFLVVNSWAVKMTSQYASGGSFLTGLDHLSVCQVSNVSFPFVFVLCSKVPFCMGSKISKEFISFLAHLSSQLPPLLLAETSLYSGLSFFYSSPPQKRLADEVHEIYDEYLHPLILQYEHSLPQRVASDYHHVLRLWRH